MTRDTKIKLYCIPYAGASQNAYFAWKKKFSTSIEQITFELSGKGARFNEPLYFTINDAVEDLFKLFWQQAEGEDYAIYGHSMGSILAYELVKKIENAGLKSPVHLFVSGMCAPNMNQREKYIHRLTERELFAELRKFGGTDEAFFHSQELSRVFIPILRNDLRLTETYHDLKEIKIKCPITVFEGGDDSFKAEQVEAWKKYTNEICNIIYFEGGHFFIHKYIEELTEYINQKLKQYIEELSYV